MPKMIWKRSKNYISSPGKYHLQLVFELSNSKLEGMISVNSPYATFRFPSLGIAGKKIRIASDEEMQKEAETFLLKKLDKRLNELNEIKQLLEKKEN